MIFVHKVAFLALLPAAFFLFRVFRSRRQDAVTFSSLDAAKAVPKSIRLRFMWLPDLARILAVIFLVCAIARPQTEEIKHSQEREGVAMELIVDISSSMDMRMKHGERELSRLTVAKEVLLDFIEGDSEAGLTGRKTDLLGLITFSRYADTISPLTLSHEHLSYLTRNLKINDFANEDGTAYGEATLLAAARLSEIEKHIRKGGATGPISGTIKSKAVILLTDGENNSGFHLPPAAAAKALEWGVKIYVISITDPTKSQFVRVEGGESIEAARARSAPERGLEAMAKKTGGIYRAAYDFDSLQAVYAEIDELEQTKMRSTVRTIPKEQFHWFAFLALLFIIAEVCLRSTWFRMAP